MKRIRYRFNKETISFEEIQLSFKEIIVKRILPLFAGASSMGIILFIAALYWVDSPFEKKLRQANSDMLLSFEVLNKNMDKIDRSLNEIAHRDDNTYRLIFESQAIPENVRKAGFGGSDRYARFQNSPQSNLLINTTYRMDVLTKQLVVQSKSFDEVIELVKNKQKFLASIPAIQPILGKDIKEFGSPFGMRFHPILHYKRMHEGIDLTAKTGTKIHATGDGLIIRAESEAGGFGRHVRISHGYGYVTVYGHMSKILVHEGQKVKRGEVIGLVGSTGLSQCPHLHYEVHVNDRPVNPLNYYYNDLTDDQYQKILESSSKTDTHIFEDL